MYSWGDDTKAWKSPGAYDYGEAMKPYLEKEKAVAPDDRSYAVNKKGPDLKLVDPKGRTITTESEFPVIIGVDGTGSMQTWPAEIFDRLPLLYTTLAKYQLDPATKESRVALSFGVIGDAASDKWPVQISDFGKGVTLDTYLKALKPEGGGGPGIRESYELFAQYLDTNVSTPKAVSPFLILMGDEKFYEQVDPTQAKTFLGTDIGQPRDSRELWRSLAQRFDIYLLRKSYAGRDEEIRSQWDAVLAPQHIIPVDDPARVVDVAIGLIAQRWGQATDFQKSLKARQDSKGITKVMESLRAAPNTPAGMGSKLKSPTPGAKSKKLTE